MKRKNVYLPIILVLLLILTSCGRFAARESCNETAFRLSGIFDSTDESAERVYKVVAPYSDVYRISSEDVSGISVYQNGRTVADGETELEASLVENEEYILKVETEAPNSNFRLETVALNNKITLPYGVEKPSDVSDISLENTDGDPLQPCEIKYEKRSGGKYIYCNNPELIPADSVGDAFIRTEKLHGEVYFTFEHANWSGEPLYLGYQIKNDSDSDAFITVTNIGYQVGGSWFGQRAWYDFYNTKFKLPDDYFTENGEISEKYAELSYDYTDYTPRVFQPITYRLPAGEYFYIIGGTTDDAYNNISVDNSADKQLEPYKCANGNVKFCVTGGSVTGTFYAYTEPAQVQANPEPRGYRGGDYARQYLGTADHSGIIDGHFSWTFNDNTPSGMLPIKYTNYYDENRPEITTPYAEYNSTAHLIESTVWMTHLNPQNDHRALGHDLVEFVCKDENGRDVIIDNWHADVSGKKSNTANWMIEYQDHFTFINQGDAEREITLNYDDNGSLALLVRDSETGEVIDNAYTLGLAESEINYRYKITVPAHSVRQITIDYLLVACSYGNIKHSVELN